MVAVNLERGGDVASPMPASLSALRPGCGRAIDRARSPTGGGARRHSRRLARRRRGSGAARRSTTSARAYRIDAASAWFAARSPLPMGAETADTPRPPLSASTVHRCASAPLRLRGQLAGAPRYWPYRDEDRTAMPAVRRLHRAGRWRSVCACLTAVGQVKDRSVTTVEGPAAHPIGARLQAAFLQWRCPMRRLRRHAGRGDGVADRRPSVGGNVAMRSAAIATVAVRNHRRSDWRRRWRSRGCQYPP